MKNILVVTYYWPPSGAAAVQRWLKISRKLHKEGHNVVIITTKKGDYPQIDESLLKVIPKDLKVVKTNSINYGTMFKFLTREKKLPYGNMITDKKDSFFKRAFYWIRMNFIVPDARVGWVPFAIRAAKKEMSLQKFDAVITTGPPHSTHLVGYFLKKKFGIKWISDFRDPWTNIFYNKKTKRNKFIVKIDKFIEKEVVKNSDYTLLVSKSWLNVIPKGNVVIMPNAFLASEFENIKYSKSDNFRIKYIGKFINYDYIDDVLEQIGEFSQKKDNIEISFIGDYGCVTPELKRKYPKISFICKDFIPHKDAIQEMVNSEMLILLINDYDGNKGLVPSKVFEYIATRTFILGYGPSDGDAAQYIKESQSGVMIDYGNKDMIRKTLEEQYNLWSEVSYEKNIVDIRKFSVENQIKLILKLIS